MYSCSPHYVVEQTKAPLSPSPPYSFFTFFVINWTGFPPYCLTCWILLWMNEIYIFSLLTWDALVGFFLGEKGQIIGTNFVEIGNWVNWFHPSQKKLGDFLFIFIIYFKNSSIQWTIIETRFPKYAFLQILRILFRRVLLVKKGLTALPKEMNFAQVHCYHFQICIVWRWIIVAPFIMERQILSSLVHQVHKFVHFRSVWNVVFPCAF
jgi:hypothetical protein